MKAKELAAILLENPEAEVVHYQYTGGDTPLLEITEVLLKPKGKNVQHRDGGDFVDKNGIATEDILILVN